MRFEIYFFLIYFSLNVEATVNDVCVDEVSGLTGLCKNLFECYSYANVIKRNDSRSMTVCNKETRKICCPLRYLTSTEQPEQAEVKVVQDALRKSSPDVISPRQETQTASRMVKNCREYQKLQVKNETINAFILGEDSTTTLTEFCYQNKRDIGTAIEKEFPHVAIIKLTNRQLPKDHYGSEKKCVGSLLSDRHVLTSVQCVKSDLHHKLSVQLGAFKYDDDILSQTFDVEDIFTKYGLTILKLSKKVEFSQHVMPICLSPDEELQSKALLVGWSGDWRECDLKLKKWEIERSLVEQKEWQLIIDGSAVLNYRQTLLPGSPLQVYHPTNTCQYSLIGVYESTSSGQYHFNHLHRKLRWIENIVWPRKLVQMSNMNYEIIKKGLKESQ